MLRATRRRVLLGTSVAVGTVAGCVHGGDEDDVLGDPEYVDGRPDPGGVPMSDLPDLTGELTIYSGRSRTRVGELLEYVEDRYDELSLSVRYDDAADLVAAIEHEAETPADVFYGSEVGTLTHLAEAGALRELPGSVLGHADPEAQDPEGHWTGFTRRFRAIGYDSRAYDSDDLPEDIFAYAADERFREDVMWAPDQGSFQAFVTAMREIHGEDETVSWLRAMVDDQQVRTSPGGDSAMAQAVADGEVGVALTNHYALRDHPNSALALAFTSGDAGAMFNVTGGGVTADSDDPEMASAFVAHLVSAEAQEYFATTTWEYPTIDGVDPIDELPGTDSFEPPSFELTTLGDVEPTLGLLREEGVL